VSSFYYRAENAPKPNLPRRVSVVALIEHEGRLLLERRADAPLWGLVGGRVENAESLDGALRREV
jgi:8-oxo-dGTP pyrophosphatase MutT (NUDIX family)